MDNLSCLERAGERLLGVPFPTPHVFRVLGWNISSIAFIQAIDVAVLIQLGDKAHVYEIFRL